MRSKADTDVCECSGQSILLFERRERSTGAAWNLRLRQPVHSTILRQALWAILGKGGGRF